VQDCSGDSIRSTLDADPDSPITDPRATVRKSADNSVTIGENRPGYTPIEGGTSEVMLGIVAKRILDLPGA